MRRAANPTSLLLGIVVGVLLGGWNVVPAQPPGLDPMTSPAATPAAEKERTAAGTRRALIFCGHPGDAEHEESYAAVLEALTTTLTSRLRFPAGQVLVWHGTKPQEAKRPSQGVCRGPATWEAIQAGARELREKLKPEDTLCVFVIGHAHFDGRRVFFNLPGPDADAEQFGKLFQGLVARQQVFFITTPASGYAVKVPGHGGRGRREGKGWSVK